MTLMVIAYPEIKKKDHEWIQDLRNKHDTLHYESIDPHFTIISSVFNLNKEEMKLETKKKSKRFNCFDFCLRCAVVNKNPFNDYWHVFLVPDEGFSEIIKIHDKLYSGKLKDELFLAIPFIPHLEVANSTNPNECKKLVDDLNSKNLEIYGKIKKLTVVNYKSEILEEIQSIELD